MQDPVHKRCAICDKSGFSGRAGRVAKATVINCDDVRVRLRGQVAVSVRPPALGDMAGVAMYFWVAFVLAMSDREGGGTIAYTI